MRLSEETKVILLSYIMALARMKERAKRIAQRLRDVDEVLIVSHIDADGITSASIAYEALRRMGKEVEVEFVKQLEKKNIDDIDEEGYDLIWFTDLGSGQLTHLKGLNCVITDHHEPQGKAGEPPVEDRGNILSYSRQKISELNPHRHGIDGATELSGAGTTYLVAGELGDNSDLSKLAVIGAVGDLQASKKGRLIGKNRDILEEGVTGGYVKKKTDALLYGLESRPLPKVLEYASDPILPGLTGDENACINFLVDLDIPLKEDGEWRKWYQLSSDEKRKIMSSLAKKLLERGYSPRYVDELVGEVYSFPDEEVGSMLHEAKEFSTLLNSCGRYKKGEIGLNICIGNREEYLEEAKKMLKGHQQVLVDCMNYVESEGIIEKDYLQYFHGGDEVPDTVLGTVTGMILGSGDVDRSRPMIAFTVSEDRDGIKVSSRGTKRLVRNGLDLSKVMSRCSKELDGEGGGHDIAAGAFIPEGKEDEFLDKAEHMIKEQLEGR